MEYYVSSGVRIALEFELARIMIKQRNANDAIIEYKIVDICALTW